MPRTSAPAADTPSVTSNAERKMVELYMPIAPEKIRFPGILPAHRGRLLSLTDGSVLTRRPSLSG
jgi:hypothetical protein